MQTQLLFSMPWLVWRGLSCVSEHLWLCSLSSWQREMHLNSRYLFSFACSYSQISNRHVNRQSTKEESLMGSTWHHCCSEGAFCKRAVTCHIFQVVYLSLSGLRHSEPQDYSNSNRHLAIRMNENRCTNVCGLDQTHDQALKLQNRTLEHRTSWRRQISKIK